MTLFLKYTSSHLSPSNSPTRKPLAPSRKTAVRKGSEMAANSLTSSSTVRTSGTFSLQKRSHLHLTRERRHPLVNGAKKGWHSFSTGREKSHEKLLAQAFVLNSLTALLMVSRMRLKLDLMFVSAAKLEKQILKDAELIQAGKVRGAHWYFFRGAQQDILDFLDAYGIPYTIH